MPRDQSPGNLQALLSQETAAAFLVLLTVTDAQDNDTLITSDSVNTVYDGLTYFPLPFNITLPKNIDGMVSTSTLSIDNVDRTFINTIRSPDQDVPLRVNIKVVLSEDLTPTGLMAEFADFTLRQITYDLSSISGTLTHEPHTGMGGPLCQYPV